MSMSAVSLSCIEQPLRSISVLTTRTGVPVRVRGPAVSSQEVRLELRPEGPYGAIGPSFGAWTLRREVPLIAACSLHQLAGAYLQPRPPCKQLFMLKHACGLKGGIADKMLADIGISDVVYLRRPARRGCGRVAKDGISIRRAVGMGRPESVETSRLTTSLVSPSKLEQVDSFLHALASRLSELTTRAKLHSWLCQFYRVAISVSRQNWVLSRQLAALVPHAPSMSTSTTTHSLLASANIYT
ncbi:hypothetical protein EDC01DRAFT_731560 [Geopyxis carbonaria]|nr:hypothetical protein EDC01DRAFT_731560 [Geopyxis carbonaria]